MPLCADLTWQNGIITLSKASHAFNPPQHRRHLLHGRGELTTAPGVIVDAADDLYRHCVLCIPHFLEAAESIVVILLLGSARKITITEKELVQFGEALLNEGILNTSRKSARLLVEVTHHLFHCCIQGHGIAGELVPQDQHLFCLFQLYLRISHPVCTNISPTFVTYLDEFALDCGAHRLALIGKGVMVLGFVVCCKEWV
mmetsp:Transcript_51736/g.75710  ORF Transcript_51736/g.75710 Transcript_51736/m.75710 type:complete len:200 (+) Transcript_51736:5487-6086(+)